MLTNMNQLRQLFESQQKRLLYLIQNVLKNSCIREYADGHSHLQFNTGIGCSQSLNALTFKVFNTSQLDQDHIATSTMNKHLVDLNRLIDIKCDSNDKIKSLVVIALAKSNIWTKTIQNALDIQHQLNAKQTIINFKNSKQSLTKFHQQGVYINKILQTPIRKGIDVIRNARKEEAMETQVEQFKLLQCPIPKSEKKSNNDEVSYELKPIATSRCNPLELIARSYRDELNNHKVAHKNYFGQKTAVVDFSVDKFEKGTMYSILLDSKDDGGNNSAERRRPLAWMESPAVENRYNLKVLLQNIKNDLTVLKQNASFLQIKIGNNYHVAVLNCDYKYKKQLDDEWTTLNNVNKLLQPKSILEGEILRRKKKWNIMNEKINKIFILESDAIETDLETISIVNDLGNVCLCLATMDVIQCVYVLKKVKQTDAGFQYLKVGTCPFYNDCFQLERNLIQIDENSQQFIDFKNDNANMEIVYICARGGGDFCSHGNVFGMGGGGCSYFCGICEIGDKNEYSNRNTLYRTAESIAKQRVYAQEASNDPSMLKDAAETLYQYSRGISEDEAAETYIGCSRIKPANLHMKMGFCTAILNIQEEYMKLLGDPNEIQKLINNETAALDETRKQLEEMLKAKLAKLLSNETRQNKQKEALKRKGYTYFCSNCPKAYKTQNGYLKHEQANICSKKAVDKGFITLNKQLQSATDRKQRLQKNINNLNTLLNDAVNISDPVPAFQTKLDECNVFKNKYYKNMEGNQAKAYLLKWDYISNHIEETTFYKYLKPVIDDLNSYFSISCKQIFNLSRKQIISIKTSVLNLKKHWNEFVNKCETIKDFSLGNKSHYLMHGYEHQASFEMTFGTDDEQNVEKYNKIVAEI
eukprot:84011_1